MEPIRQRQAVVAVDKGEDEIPVVVAQADHDIAGRDARAEADDIHRIDDHLVV